MSGVAEGVALAVAVAVLVTVGVAVRVTVGVRVGVAVTVAVLVAVAVRVDVAVLVGVAAPPEQSANESEPTRVPQLGPFAEPRVSANSPTYHNTHESAGSTASAV